MAGPADACGLWFKCSLCKDANWNPTAGKLSNSSALTVLHCDSNVGIRECVGVLKDHFWLLSIKPVHFPIFSPALQQRCRNVTCFCASPSPDLWTPNTVSVPLTVPLGDGWDWLSKSFAFVFSNAWHHWWLSHGARQSQQSTNSHEIRKRKEHFDRKKRMRRPRRNHKQKFNQTFGDMKNNETVF